jgi:hypothetical protein
MLAICYAAACVRDKTVVGITNLNRGGGEQDLEEILADP